MKENSHSRILMIAPLPPPVHGSAMMTQYIKDSEMINETVRLDWINLSTSRRMNEIGRRSLVKIWRFLSSYIKTFYKLCTIRYDTCYLAITCHGSGFLKDAPFALLCKLFRHRIIIHQHNKGMSDYVDKPIYRLLFKSVYSNATVILLSERLYPDISKIVDRSQVVIVPNGIPQVEFIKKSITEVPRIIFLSNLIESKGVYVLLDACKILNEMGRGFLCCFVGSETHEISKAKFEEEVKKRGLGKVIEYLGPKYGKEKLLQLSQSDLLVFPTVNECFPLVILEAMRQGLPVISTDVGGIADIIEHGKTGFILDNTDPKKLAYEISNILTDRILLNACSIEAQKRYAEKYTLEQFEKSILKILQSNNSD